jgi:shikimate kinase
MAVCEKILIAGFSGAGKSSLLQALKTSAPEGWELFNDLDRIILKSHGKGHENLASLIDSAGWDKFRLWERQALDGWLKEEAKGVLALGGGTLSPLVWELFGKNRKLKFIHLDIPFAEACKRLSLDDSEPRPLLKLGQLELERIYQERRKVFEQLPLQLNGLKSPQENAIHIWNSMGNW